MSLLCLSFQWFLPHSEQSQNPHKIQLSPIGSVPCVPLWFTFYSSVCSLALTCLGPYCFAKPGMRCFILLSTPLAWDAPPRCSHGSLPHSLHICNQMSPSHGDALWSFSTAISPSNLPILIRHFSSALWINWVMYIFKFIFVYYLFLSLKCKIIDFTLFALFVFCCIFISWNKNLHILWMNEKYFILKIRVFNFFFLNDSLPSYTERM